MSNRKSKVIIIFSVMLIAMNLIAFTQAMATTNRLFDGKNDTNLQVNTASNEVSLPVAYEATAEVIPNLNPWDLSINVTRVIDLYDYGYLTVSDNFTIINNDNVTLPIFRFAIPNTLVSEMVGLEGSSAWDTSSEMNSSTITKEYQNDQFTFYVMTLDSPLLGNNKTKYFIEVEQIYLRPYEIYNLYTETDPGTSTPVTILVNGARMNISATPFITKPIQYCQTTFLKPENGQIISDDIWPKDTAQIGEASVIYNPYENIPSYNFSKEFDFETYDYRITIGAYLMKECPTIALLYKRTITIDNWYYAKFSEEITFKSESVTPEVEILDLTNPLVYATFALLRVHLYVDNAENVKVYDEFGSLPPPSRDPSLVLVQLNRINIYFRVPLYGGDTTTVFVEYTLKLDDLLRFDKNEFILNTGGLPSVDFHVTELQLSVIFPIGSNFQYLYFGDEPVEPIESKTSVFLRIGNRDTVSITSYNVTKFSNIQLQVGYYMNDLAYFIQPLTYALILFVACLLYVGIRTLRKDVIEKVAISAEEKEEIPIELIQDFVEKYEEKTALQTRITNLDDERRRKKIKAKEYDQQRKILESKMREIIKALDTTKRDLKEKGRKYRDAIQKIEVSEEKRISVERSINDLRIRYIREKAISKDAYLRIMNDYQNQIERFERDIDREIINLRLLVEHEQKEK